MGADAGRSKPLRRLIGWWSEHPSFDFAAALTLTVMQFAGTRRWAGLDLLGQVPEDDRAMLYLGVAAVIGLVNAFSLAALSFARQNSGPRTRVLKAKAGHTIMRSWLLSIVGSLAVAGLLMLAAIFAAGEVLPGVRWGALAGVYFALLAGARSLWVFVQVVSVDVEDMTAPRGRTPPEVVRTGPDRKAG